MSQVNHARVLFGFELVKRQSLPWGKMAFCEYKEEFPETFFEYVDADDTPREEEFLTVVYQLASDFEKRVDFDVQPDYQEQAAKLLRWIDEHGVKVKSREPRWHLLLTYW